MLQEWFELHVISLVTEPFVRKTLVRMVSKLNLHILMLTVERATNFYIQL